MKKRKPVVKPINKKMLKQQLNVLNHLGSIIQEPEIQFILSLAPPVPITWEELEDIFDDDKVGREYYAARQLQLDKSIAISKESGQFKIYNSIYIPAMAKINAAFNYPVWKMSEMAKQIPGRIDALLADLLGKVPISQYHPCNKKDTAELMIKWGLDPDPYKSLFIGSEHENEIRIICKIQDYANTFHIIPPEGYVEKSIPIPTWHPNKKQLQSDAFTLGYFTGPCNKRYYTPTCLKSLPTSPTPAALKEAKSQFHSASQSPLLAYKKILNDNLLLVRINNHFKTITYLEHT